MSLLDFVFQRTFVNRWIGANENLLLLQRRLRREIPGPLRRGFYRTWVFSHITARRQQFAAGDSELAPLTIKVSPTLRCNLQCRGCFAGSFPSRGDLAIDVMERTVKQAGALGIRSVGVIGGEPLLVPGIFDLFARFPRTGFYLVTNGTLVDDDTVARLRSLPNVITIFSIEGFEQTNDALRGVGVFRRVMDGMRRLREGKVIFGFSTVVHRENVGEVVSERFIDFLIEQGCLFGGFLPYVPVGSTPRFEIVSDEDEVRAYYDRLDAIVRTRPILILKEGTSDGSFLNTGCGAGHTMHVTANGEAEPCNGIEFYTERIQDSEPQRVLASPFFRDIRRLHHGTERHCLVINEPEAVLEVVQRHGARPTHLRALEHLERYTAFRRGSGGPRAEA